MKPFIWPDTGYKKGRISGTTLSPPKVFYSWRYIYTVGGAKLTEGITEQVILSRLYSMHSIDDNEGFNGIYTQIW